MFNQNLGQTARCSQSSTGRDEQSLEVEETEDLEDVDDAESAQQNLIGEAEERAQ